MSQARPAWLSEAISAHRIKTAQTKPQSIKAGQIRRLDPMDAGSGQPLLVLIADTDDESACASVIVVSPEIEMGADPDLYLPRDVSTLPFDLVVLPDVVGPAWFVQLGPALNTATVEVSQLDSAGIPLRDAKDSRWHWKETILDSFVTLTAECRRQLLDGEAVTVADPAAFDLDVVGVKERACMTLTTIRMLDSESILVPTAALRATPVLQNSPAYPSFVALSESVLRHSSAVITDDSAEVVTAEIGRELAADPLPKALAALITRMDQSLRCIRVASVSSLWEETELLDGQRFFGLVLNGKRHQVIVANADRDEVHCA